MNETQEAKQEAKPEVKQLGNLFTALSQFQGEIKSVKKGTINPFFKSKYADLATLWDNIREPLSKNGLAVTQLMGGQELTTILGHESGEYLTSTVKFPLTQTIIKDADGNPVTPIQYKTNDDPQSIGSSISYYRRYALSAILGLSAEGEDDDAEGAMDRKYAPRKELRGEITQPQIKKVHALSREMGYSKEQLAALSNELFPGVASLTKLTKAQASTLIESIGLGKGL